MGLFSRLFSSSDSDDSEELLERVVGDIESRENIIKTARENPGKEMEYGYFLIWSSEESGPIFTAPSTFQNIVYEPPIENTEIDTDVIRDRTIRSKLDGNIERFDAYHSFDYHTASPHNTALTFLQENPDKEHSSDHMHLFDNGNGVEVTFKSPISGESIEDPESLYSFTSPIEVPRDEKGNLERERLEKKLTILGFEHIYHHPDFDF